MERDAKEKREICGIEMTPVASSNVAAVGYRAEGGMLAVEFKNGTAYCFPNVPERIYLGLIEAESKGKYFASKIRHAYRGVLVRRRREKGERRE